MTIQLSKTQKKIARGIIEKGLQREYVAGIEHLEKIIGKWRRNRANDRDTWFELYNEVTSHDKNIARRYDDISGSKYLLVIMNQLINEVIREEDLADLDEDLRERLLMAARQY